MFSDGVAGVQFVYRSSGFLRFEVAHIFEHTHRQTCTAKAKISVSVWLTGGAFSIVVISTSSAELQYLSLVIREVCVHASMCVCARMHVCM